MPRTVRQNRFLITGFLFFYILLFSSTLTAQENAEEQETEALPEVPEVKLTPIFPDSEEGLIYIEGEDAVSTNFATAPIYNYGASAYRSLQLIQQNAPYGGKSYYAEYAFYVEEEGDYLFWYGGTPPGPREDVFPSYASPFKYILDDKEAVPVYREDLSVVEAYTPSYYWMEVGKITLSKGVHKLRVEVSDKRRYDGQYYFFMDAFFFLREDRMEEELVLVPDVFPENRLDRSIDNPFQSIAYYENMIKENPGNKGAYIVVSMIYSLLGDYINAIKNLNSAVNLDPEDPYPLLLMAKNRIWNGEVTAGLTLYKQLVILAPDNTAYWAEAGKVAAWTGNYRDSIDFFTRGLEKFPEDLNLKVNLGLTYLWMSRSGEAETVFSEAEENSLGSHDRAMKLGNIHSLNGYPQFAVDIYKKEIAQSPEYLETYLNLEKAYRDTGERDKAEELISLIYDSFEESSAFSSYMNVYEEKLQMKQDILDGYRKALDENPDNINLRQELAQTYFWNGLKEEAVDESLRILVNKMFHVFKDFDSKAEDLLTLKDKLSYTMGRYRKIMDAYGDASKQLSSVQSAYKKAEAAVQKKPEDTELAARLDEQFLVYADAYNMAQVWMDRLADQESVLEDLKDNWESLSAAEEEDEELFRQLMGDLDWSWDRSFTKMELRQVQRDEPFLAGYILGRLALFEGRMEEAARILSTDAFEDSPFARYGLYEAFLWQNNNEQQEKMWADEADVLTLYRQHLFDLEATDWSEPGAGSFLPSDDEVASLTGFMNQRIKEFDTDREELDKLAGQIGKAMDKKLNRSIYYLEQETYMLRFELGDYYLEMEENLKASRQFDRVLAMDPWNISANYKLGIVSQRYGNWYRAMHQYEKVYLQNPLYENAAYYYNQLARANADYVHVTAQNILDPSCIAYTGTAEYSSKVNNWLGWGLNYQLDIDRQYRTYGSEDPSSFKLHTATFDLPVQLPAWNLELTPFGGVHMSNAFFGSDFGFNPYKPVSVEDNLIALTSSFTGGLGLGWSYDFLTVDLEYKYALEEDSLYYGRNLTNGHGVQLNANTYFPVQSDDKIGPVTTRTFGSLKILQSEDVSGTNQIRQVVQEVSAGYLVSQKPSVRLTLNGQFNYEDSLDTGLTDYYAPDEVYEVKGGLRGTLGVHNAQYTESAEISLWGSGGSYWSAGGDPSLKVEGQFSAYYVKETMMLYLLVGGYGTFDEGLAEDPLFWELSATLGCRINVPSLLVP